MSKVVSMRFKEAQLERLGRLARRLSRTPSETGALLIEEGLRRAEFALIDFRDSPAGRQACVQGSALAVWEVVEIADAYQGNLERAAEHLKWPVVRVIAALNYSAAFPEETASAREDNRGYDEEAVRRLLPGASVFRAGGGGPGGSAARG